MSNTYRLNGSASLLHTLIRGLVLTAMAIGGFFMLAFSAAFAFFVVVGLLLFGAVVFGLFWLRAKIFGRPFGPRAQFEAARKDFERQIGGGEMGTDDIKSDGPIIDAHETPEGWSVND